jgi:hypothetical protein
MTRICFGTWSAAPPSSLLCQVCTNPFLSRATAFCFAHSFPPLPCRVRFALRPRKLAAPDRPRVIVQMPRGNLETVYPRALTLYAINHALAARDYARAFMTARVDRIDLNLLYDHNPTDFLQVWHSPNRSLARFNAAHTQRLAWRLLHTQHVGEFVSGINNEEYLNLFLSDLTNEDCTKTKYPRYVGLPPRDAAPAAASAPADSKHDATASLAAKLKSTARHPLDDRQGTALSC